MNKLTNYINIRDELKTGDLVLFTGTGLVSNIIKLSGEFTHIGMIVNFLEYDFTCLWESTTLSTLKDLESGTLIKGVQLVPLSKRISTYDGDIAIRKLIGVKPDIRTNKALLDFRRNFNGRKYEKSIMDLIGSAFDIFADKVEDLSTLFCSELVAEAYQRMGLLSEDTPSDMYSPSDFSEEGGLELLTGHLGPEMRL